MEPPGRAPREKHALAFHHGFREDPSLRSAQGDLLYEVFGLAADLDADNSRWTPLGWFDGNRCVASVDVGHLTLLVAGEEKKCAAIRLAAVGPGWRGAGLFRDLMARALHWSDAAISDLCLLYTEDPALYERFGFRGVAQHLFTGTGPAVVSPQPARPLNLKRSDDRALIHRLLSIRVPSSRRCAVIGTADLFVANLARSDDLRLAYAAAIDALIVFEVDNNSLTVVDVVAADIPPMTAILAALGLRCERITTMFCPDRLDWEGMPILDETGLMARGPLPEGLSRPFMLPPTTEF